ncbi:MAG: potassium transporter Kup [Deltaproteobacteria bacterium]|nr:potassium transporter Kup [Deltaproteobacteria bacterium]
MRPELAGLALGALGVVYGDIGTSPIYAFRQCLSGPSGVAPDPADVLGIASLIFWSLIVVVSVKYLAFVMRADNQGEGGVLALLALILPHSKGGDRSGGTLAAFGLFGAALLYGDGVITPAISVLSAVEGIGIATQALDPLVVPITVVILCVLFRLQRYGTARVSAVFGPAMLVWFVTIGALGAAELWKAEATEVWTAVHPGHAVGFLTRRGVQGFLTLGSVVLVVTGCEALYADMGHFGAKPIRVAWYAFVLPALVLNYFGQAAHVLAAKELSSHPFFDLAPSWFLYPLIGIATVATIIASQALISGAFSLTQQAVQLDFLPRLRVVHTSDVARGQIYMPAVNVALTILCVGLVLGFRSSDALASAYGIAVTGTMTVTSVLFFLAARRRWRWPWIAAAALAALFLAFDLPFLVANLVKLDTGGWFPVAVAAIVFVTMTTWRRGRALVARKQAEWAQSCDDFFAMIEREKPVRVPGTAVYLTSVLDGISPVLLHNFLANRVIHERVVLLSTVAVEKPRVDPEERATVVDLGQGVYRAITLFGFFETPRIDAMLKACAARGLVIDEKTALYFTSRSTPLPTGKSRMPRWRKNLYSFLSRNTPSLTNSFCLPSGRVVEMDSQVEI